jgi:thymidylate synthase
MSYPDVLISIFFFDWLCYIIILFFVDVSNKRRKMVKIYQPLYKPNQVFCGTGQTVIVTGWTLKGAIKKKLEEHEYGAIGQLYSPTRGINFLVRNLLWNPHIRFLIVVNATKEDKNSGAVQCLLDFFREGFKS